MRRDWTITFTSGLLTNSILSKFGIFIFKLSIHFYFSIVYILLPLIYSNTPPYRDILFLACLQCYLSLLCIKTPFSVFACLSSKKNNFWQEWAKLEISHNMKNYCKVHRLKLHWTSYFNPKNKKAILSIFLEVQVKLTFKNSEENYIMLLRMIVLT